MQLELVLQGAFLQVPKNSFSLPNENDEFNFVPVFETISSTVKWCPYYPGLSMIPYHLSLSIVCPVKLEKTVSNFIINSWQHLRFQCKLPEKNSSPMDFISLRTSHFGYASDRQ